MIKRLVEMYDNGAITGYQLMMDCLQRLDPAHPELVLDELPGEILDEILDYAKRYDAARPRSDSMILPAEDQVKTAERWVKVARVKTS